MNEPDPIPPELQHLIEKRDQERREEVRRAEDRGEQPPPADVDPERRIGQPRRGGARRVDDSGDE